MATAVVMPKLGNTVESSIIVAWRKKKGDQVAQGEVICEIETDKATIDLESPAAGTLLDIFFQEGDEVPVLMTIAAIGSPGENIDDLRPEGAISPASAPVQPTAPAPTNGKELAAPTPSAASVVGGDMLRISPRARNLAARRGVDVSAVQGTGPKGRIIERDIEAALRAQPRLTPVAQKMVESGEFMAPAVGSGPGGRITSKDLAPTGSAPAAAAAAPQMPADEVEVIPLKGTRKIIAERMLNSMQTTAQLTLNAFADARALQAYRGRLKSSPEELGLQKVTINDLILFVVSRMLVNFPDLNALFLGDRIEQYRAVHLGMAVDTPRGLIVPVIRSAHLLSLKQLSDEAKRLADAALNGKILPDELSGGTFTVTNLGSLGIETFTPILNPPQVCILGVGGINLKPIEQNGEVTFIPHLALSLTINHQVVDGAPGARFLQALSRNLAALEVLLAL